MLYVFLLILLGMCFPQSPLSERYHTYEEIHTQLLDWDAEFGNNPNPTQYYPNSGIIYKLMEIGRSHNDDLPFWAVKLSYNADQDQDEPRVLILGQCHAEEILGVEVSMEMIYRFLHPEQFPADYQTVVQIMQNTELWIVPTHNPEGHHVVHGWEEESNWLQDVSYRKNKNDVNENGIFDFDTYGFGNDLDGVDLNRNYDFNWFFGDGLYESDQGCSSNPSYVSNYDYYRGEYPFSESEIQAIRDLALSYDFLLSIAYHSSRSGCVAERVIYPWLWTGAKASPDYQVIAPLAQEIAELIPIEQGDGNYHFAGSGSRKGNAHDWFYSETGCIQYLIEIATSNMQPDSEELIQDTILRNLQGAYHLLKRAAGINYPTGPDKYQVTGLVSDAETGEVLDGVEVTILEMDGGMLKPRLTDDFGRYRRLLHQGSFTLKFEKYGYQTLITDSFVPSAEEVTELSVTLNPLTSYDVSFDLIMPDTFDDTVTVSVFNNNLPITSYQYSPFNSQPIELVEGEYTVHIDGEDLLPLIFNVFVSENIYLGYLEMYWYDVKFSEEFNNLDLWDVIRGEWVVDEGMLLSQEDLVYSNYNPLGPMEIRLNSGFYSTIDSGIVHCNLGYELEWDRDSLFIDVLNNNTSNIFHRLDQSWDMENYIFPINLDIENENFLSIGINPDITLAYRGLKMDNLKVLVKNDAYPCLAGDLDHDGNVAVNDIVIILNFLLGDYSLSGYQSCSSNLNNDENVDVMDIVRVVNIILEN